MSFTGGRRFLCNECPWLVEMAHRAAATIELRRRELQPVEVELQLKWTSGEGFSSEQRTGCEVLGCERPAADGRCPRGAAHGDGVGWGSRGGISFLRCARRKKTS